MEWKLNETHEKIILFDVNENYSIAVLLHVRNRSCDQAIVRNNNSNDNQKYTNRYVYTDR